MLALQGAMIKQIKRFVALGILQAYTTHHGFLHSATTVTLPQPFVTVFLKMPPSYTTNALRAFNPLLLLRPFRCLTLEDAAVPRGNLA